MTRMMSKLRGADLFFPKILPRCFYSMPVLGTDPQKKETDCIKHIHVSKVRFSYPLAPPLSVDQVAIPSPFNAAGIDHTGIGYWQVLHYFYLSGR